MLACGGPRLCSHTRIAVGTAAGTAGAVRSCVARAAVRRQVVFRVIPGGAGLAARALSCNDDPVQHPLAVRPIVSHELRVSARERERNARVRTSVA